MSRFYQSVLLACLAATLAACGNAVNGDVTATGAGGSTVNGSVRVPAGLTSGAVSSVNGSIRIEEGATVASAHAVNGEIDVGPRASVESVVTVNGSIRLAEAARIGGDAKSVNGEIALQKGVDVAGSVTTVDGSIDLVDAHVHGQLRTTAASITVTGASHVDGGILVEKNAGSLFNTTTSSKPRITIGPGAVVGGTLRFEREVQLYVSDQATVGPIEGATAIKFSGDKPPA
ncbi:MAG: hypothetical protein JSR36_14610 [Proteobacteria bacterium]|nr:hypothetical protein [Pseudomonadota bacterium]